VNRKIPRFRRVFEGFGKNVQEDGFLLAFVELLYEI
jgi:hypothetical protein